MISCPLIAPFDPDNWLSIESAFRGTPSLTMTQHWLKEPQPHFLPATVQLAHNGSALVGLAYLPDHEIVTRAEKDQEMMYLLGDVFEIFLKSAQLKSYVELHVTPNGMRLQLSFPDRAREVLEHSPIQAFMVEEPLFDFRVMSGSGFWKVWFAVPAATLGISAAELRQSEWRASFSRYDYGQSKDDAPILSSTSQHVELDYHRLEEWTPITFA